VLTAASRLIKDEGYAPLNRRFADQLTAAVLDLAAKQT
jgi:hypothetical protein